MGIPVYTPTGVGMYQSGRGVGSALASLARTVFPHLLKAGIKYGPGIVRAGAQARKKGAKGIAKAAAKAALSSVPDLAMDLIPQRGSGVRRRKRRRKMPKRSKRRRTKRRRRRKVM